MQELRRILINRTNNRILFQLFQVRITGITVISVAADHEDVPEVEVSDLSNIILETIASLNEINPLTTRLIQIARDGKISDDEIKDFAFISNKLDEISLAIDSLNLWVDKTAGEQGLNIELLREEKKKQK